MTSSARRLRTVGSAAAMTAGLSVVVVAAHLWRAADNASHFPADLDFGWRAPFVDGASPDAGLLGLAALVLVLMLPTSPTFRLVRRLTLWLLLATVAANVVAALGEASMIASPPAERPEFFFGTSVLGVLLGSVPAFGLAVITGFVAWSEMAGGGGAPAADEAPEASETAELVDLS